MLQVFMRLREREVGGSDSEYLRGEGEKGWDTAEPPTLYHNCFVVPEKVRAEEDDICGPLSGRALFGDVLTLPCPIRKVRRLCTAFAWILRLQECTMWVSFFAVQV